MLAVMGTEKCPWVTLLALANLHRVTLLWYLRLQQHGLTERIPADLRDYLDALLEQNRSRNRNLLIVLEPCLGAFSREGVEVILLKGAAALGDDLYADVGARIMGDGDLLIRADQQIQVDQVLQDLGFQVAPESQENPFYRQHHHLPPYQYPEWQVCLEIHGGITDFAEKRAFPTERLFARAEAVSLCGRQAKTLHLSDRLLHNACHAMVQDAGWLYSWCSLHELAEWDLLLRRETSVIDFEELLTHAREGGFALSLKIYALAANRLFGSPVPTDWTGRWEDRHVRRLMAGLGWRGTTSPQPTAVRLHYLLHVLPRTWRYHHFSRQQVPFHRRMGHFLKLALRPSSWERLRPR
ncbi:MAG: nucleotidyltransferase family protein [Desulfuromonadales bacterium]